MENDRVKNEAQTLAHNLKERTRKHQQTQDLYDRLKRKQMTAATQFAAQNAAYESVEDVEFNNHRNTSQGNRGSQAFGTDQGDLERPNSFQKPNGNIGSGIGGIMPPPRSLRPSKAIRAICFNLKPC